MKQLKRQAATKCTTPCVFLRSVYFLYFLIPEIAISQASRNSDLGALLCWPASISSLGTYHPNHLSVNLQLHPHHPGISRKMIRSLYIRQYH